MMQRAWRALGVWAVLGILGAGAPLFAQSLDQDSSAPIEQYHGVRRVDTVQKKLSAGPAPTANTNPPAKSKDIPAAKPLRTAEVAPPLPAPRNLEVSWLVDGEGADVVRPSNFVARIEEQAPRDNKDAGIAPPTGLLPAPESVVAAPQADAPAAPVGPAGVLPPTVASPLVRTPHDPERSITVVARQTPEAAWILAGPAFVSALLTPLVLLLGVWLLLRRFKGFAGPVIRIENVGGAQQTFSLRDLAGLLQTESLRAAPTHPAPEWAAANAPEVETTAQPFDLGPTFEEARILQEEQGRQQEAGLLQQMFEDNLKLQKQVSELEPVPA